MDEGLSLSRFPAKELELRVAGVTEYRAARERQIEWMQRGFDLRANEAPRVSRDILHEAWVLRSERSRL